MNDVELAEAIRAALATHRAHGRVPTEILLSQERWNLLRRQMTFGSFGDKKAVLFEGLPCVLIVGMTQRAGFKVRAIEGRD